MSITSPGDTTGGTAKRHRFGMWATALAFLVVLAFSTAPSPLYAVYATRDGFSAFVVTLIYAAYAVGVMASLFFVSHRSDVHGRRPHLIVALALALVSDGVFLLWPALPGLFVARIICGLAVGMTVSTATAAIREHHQARSPGAAPGVAALTSSLVNAAGLGVGAALGGLVAQYAGGPLTTPANGTIVLLGGTNGNDLSDTWTWQGGQWTAQTPATVPPARSLAAGGFDPLLGGPVMFAGGTAYLSDTWLWTGTNWTAGASIGNNSGRNSMVCTFDPQAGAMIEFRGQGSSGGLDSGTFQFAPASTPSPTWNLESPSTSSPGVSGPAMDYDPASGQLLMFGGSTGSAATAATWSWGAGNWTQLSPGTSPPARSQAARPARRDAHHLRRGDRLGRRRLGYLGMGRRAGPAVHDTVEVAAVDGGDGV